MALQIPRLFKKIAGRFRRGKPTPDIKRALLNRQGQSEDAKLARYIGHYIPHGTKPEAFTKVAEDAALFLAKDRNWAKDRLRGKLANGNDPEAHRAFFEAHDAWHQQFGNIVFNNIIEKVLQRAIKDAETNKTRRR